MLEIVLTLLVALCQPAPICSRLCYVRNRSLRTPCFGLERAQVRRVIRYKAHYTEHLRSSPTLCPKKTCATRRSRASRRVKYLGYSRRIEVRITPSNSECSTAVSALQWAVRLCRATWRRMSIHGHPGPSENWRRRHDPRCFHRQLRTACTWIHGLSNWKPILPDQDAKPINNAGSFAHWRAWAPPSRIPRVNFVRLQTILAQLPRVSRSARLTSEDARRSSLTGTQLVTVRVCSR